MVHKVIDRCKETTSTTGTGTLTLTGAATGFVSMANAATGLTSNGDTSWFCAENISEWEVFLGTRVSATELARTTVLSSSNGGSAVNFTSPPVVFSTVPADKLSSATDKSILRAYLTAAGNSGSSASVKVQIDTVSLDSGGMWNAANKRVIPAKAGHYEVTGRVRVASAATMALYVVVNGSTYLGIGAEGSVNAVAGSTLVYCNGTTDYFELFVYTSVAKAITTGADTTIQVVGPI